ncbi:hypothetical protein NKH36_24230 [Mesorhizobium sp. M1312]|uniref:hypothetical protein n=1 Tax=unclassified Mesorhizobium TaxID=325217 RepID=UPI00333CA9A4
MAGLVGKFVGKTPAPRKGMASPKLSEKEFKARYMQQFVDPAFEPVARSIEQIASIAWQAYADSRKSPITKKAGPTFSDPDYDLSVDWIAAHEAVLQAQRRHEDLTVPPRLLIINGSSRSEHTCPGEMSKSFRLAEIARETIDKETKLAVEILDLSRLASEYGRSWGNSSSGRKPSRWPRLARSFVRMIRMRWDDDYKNRRSVKWDRS